MIIKEIKRTKHGYNVTIDQEVIHLELSVVTTYKLKKNMTISLKQFKTMIHENDLQRIKRQAIIYVSKSRSVLEFKTYLRKLEAPKPYIEELTKSFKEKGYLNDEAYALELVRRYEKKYGKKRLHTILVEKGIHEDIIERTLRNHKDINLESQIKSMILTTKADNQAHARTRIKRAMSNRGYTLSEVDEYLDKYLHERDFNERETILKHYDKLYHKLSKKYDGYELNIHIKKALYDKGFSLEVIDKILQE